jgi:hypothetical protein
MRSLRSVSLIGAVLMLGTTAAASAQSDATDPVPLFNTVCVQGGGKMAAGSLRPQRYLALPLGARVALGVAVPRIDWRSQSLLEPLGPAQAPNALDAVGKGGDTFLLLPAAGQRGALAGSCVVVWKGAHFDAAKKAIRDITGLDQDDDSAAAGVHRVDVTGEGFRMAGAEAQGWTVLQATSDATAHAAPIASGNK